MPGERSWRINEALENKLGIHRCAEDQLTPMRKTNNLAGSAILVCFITLISYGQFRQSCRYYDGCRVDMTTLFLSWTGCGFNPGSYTASYDCDDLSPFCASQCSGHCNQSSVNYGYSGSVNWYDTCSNSYRQSSYECDNCGNPYPTPAPIPTSTPTPTPTPCAQEGEACYYYFGDCCDGVCGEISGTCIPCEP